MTVTPKPEYRFDVQSGIIFCNDEPMTMHEVADALNTHLNTVTQQMFKAQDLQAEIERLKNER